MLISDSIIVLNKNKYKKKIFPLILLLKKYLQIFKLKIFFKLNIMIIIEINQCFQKQLQCKQNAYSVNNDKLKSYTTLFEILTILFYSLRFWT